MTPDATGKVPVQTALRRRRAGERNSTAITCQLDVRGTRDYEVCIVPHWDPSSAVIEWYDAAAPALSRCAEVARYLRANGWIVIDHLAADTIHAAA